MPLTTVFESKTQRLEILSPEGIVDPSIPVAITQEQLLAIYGKMVEIRAFDERAFKMQRQGRLGTYPQILGQEATQIVPPLCLKPKDWLVPTYRGQGAYFARGMALRNALLYWGGDDRGVNFPEENNDLIFAIPVGSHLTQAAGLAWSCKLKGDHTVALAYLGDGTTSKGDFHESLTFAGQFQLPIIYLVENNHWAISVPREKQARTKTLAQKASGYGVFGLQADGNDVLAVHKAVSEAVERARSGLGASVIECETYRLGHHTTADDASRYRDEAEVERWKKKEPIGRLRNYLFKRGLLDQAKDSAIRKSAEAMVEEEVKAYEATPAPNPLNMFSDNYSVAPQLLVEQRARLEELLKLKQSSGEVEPLPPAEGRFP